ncbi:MAG: sulfite exporter TauE/SafE family protein [Clostridia bacterium]|nr:sulfite exporter TauE/SafE family protein [Clostridia bacterium]
MTAQNISFLVVVFLSNIIQCVTGFAGTVLAMPFSVMLVGLDTARPVLNIMGIAASVGVIARYHKDVDKKELLTILGVTLPGMLAGAFLKNAMAGYGDVLFKLLGALVILFALLNLAAFLLKKDFAEKSKAVGYAFLIAGGIVHGLFVCGGPLIVSYASVRLKENNAFRATLSAVWIVLNTILMITDAVAGSFHKDVLLLTGVCLIVLIAAIVIGNRIAAKMSRKAFLLLTYALMVVSGVSLLLK